MISFRLTFLVPGLAAFALFAGACSSGSHGRSNGTGTAGSSGNPGTGGGSLGGRGDNGGVGGERAAGNGGHSGGGGVAGGETGGSQGTVGPAGTGGSAGNLGTSGAPGGGGGSGVGGDVELRRSIGLWRRIRDGGRGERGPSRWCFRRRRIGVRRHGRKLRLDGHLVCPCRGLCRPSSAGRHPCRFQQRRKVGRRDGVFLRRRQRAPRQWKWNLPAGEDLHINRRRAGHGDRRDGLQQRRQPRPCVLDGEVRIRYVARERGRHFPELHLAA